QQALQRRELRLLDVELAGQLIDSSLQGRWQGVAGAARVLDAADGGRLVEVELAAIELAHLDQSLAERVQAGRLCLQLAQFDRQRIEASLRLHAHAAQLAVLLPDLLLQIVQLRQRTVARTGNDKCQDGAQRHTAQDRQREQRQQLPAQAPVGEVQGFRELPGA